MSVRIEPQSDVYRKQLGKKNIPLVTRGQTQDCLLTSLACPTVPEKVARANVMVHRPKWTVVEMSDHSANTINPIRRVVDVMKVEPNPNKKPLKLNIGDPSITGVLNCHPKATEAIVNTVNSGSFNGYGPATGFGNSCAALAKHITRPEAPVTAQDVILTSGCSHALEIAFEAIANPGDNILIPRPGFSVYSTQMQPMGIESRYYNLLIEQGWEIDLVHLESQINNRTKAILLNNPSNPCGAVYSKEHLQAVLRIAEKHMLVVIADEIYGDMVYDGATFHPVATLEPKVPVLSADGISKRWLVPGWRLGWLVVHDPLSVLGNIRIGLQQLTQKIVGPCAIIQGALPALLTDIPQSFFDHTRSVLSRNVKVFMQELANAPGLRPIRPQGAMYIMVSVDMARFPEFDSELKFVQALISEESVFTLPGTAFQYENAIRLVTTYPEELTKAACERITSFCVRHYV